MKFAAYGIGVCPDMRQGDRFRKSETCSASAAYFIEGTDSHEESFGLLTGGSVVEYDPQLSCATREALVHRIYTPADDWVTEAIARAVGR